MISWTLVLMSVALLAGLFGLGAVVAAMKVVIAVVVVLAVVGWAHRPSPLASRIE